MARVVSNSAPETYKQRLEDLVLDVVSANAESAVWTIVIEGFVLLRGFTVRIEGPDGLIALCNEEGFSEALRDNLHMALGAPKAAIDTV